MQAFLVSFIFVLLAEMGDKTQLLAMAFAARYSAGQVLLAVFLATLLNHACAVGAGHFLATHIPFGAVSLAAAVSFIIFGLWTLRGDCIGDEAQKRSRFGPVMTVGIAFFFAEIGDKTQLATISLAIKYSSMLNVLLGTTLAMVATDAFGIAGGVLMRKYVPEKTVKYASAGLFILFGFIAVFQVLSKRFEPAAIWWTMLLLGAATAGASVYLRSRE